MELYNKNLKLLRTTQPSLASRVEREPRLNSVRVVLAKDGNPIPQVESISLHSTYYPLEEAARNLIGFDVIEGQRPAVYGLGFGYHVLEILNKYSDKNILVIEPLMSLFQAFMESVDLKPFIFNTTFVIAEPPPKILVYHEPKNWKVYKHPASMKISNIYYKRMDRAREVSEYLAKSKLKILVVNPYYGGSLPTAKYCVQALNGLGHQAESVDCEVFVDGYLSLDKITQNKINAELLSKQFNHFMGQLVAAKASDFKPDMILSIAQAPLGPDAIKNLKLLDVPVAFWFVEDFRTLTYWKDIASSYDYFFTIQRGKFFDQLKSIGVDNYYYLPQACLPGVHRKINLSFTEMKKYSADVSFMGSGYYNRVQSLPRLLDRDLKIWGTEWLLESPLGKRVQNMNRRLSSEEIIKVYNATQININLHSSTYHNGVNPGGDFVNPRTFEILACGGFQLVDNRSELAELINIGTEVVTFKSIDELSQKVDYYLSHENEAKSIAARGQKRILKEHTFQHRMCEMLIHIFTDKLDQLKDRMDDKFRDPVNYCIDEAGPSSDLAKYLEQFRGESNFSIDSMTEHIGKGRGDLSKEELLILMVDQLVKPEFRQ